MKILSNINRLPLTLVLFLAGLIAQSLLSTPVHAMMEITNVRHWSASDHTRIVFDVSEEPQYVVEEDGQKIVLDFKGAEIGKATPRRVILKKTGVEEIVLAMLPPDGVRVTVRISEGIEKRIFKLKKFQDKPDRVVVDIELPDVEKKESQIREQIRTGKKDRIIIIDPGHGGDDPGAIGKSGLKEKTVALAISKKLQKALNNENGYRAFLTRNGDYYVPFKKRLSIGREYGADLFISIHVNAARNRTARGCSTYCLSMGGASNEAVKLLAQNENLADIIGGSGEEEILDTSGPIVLNMYQTQTINQSKVLGKILLENLKTVVPAKYANVQEAAFRVLKLPDVPSILVETAFISNPDEEKLLKSSRFQEELAGKIAESIMKFLPVRQGDAMTETVKVDMTRHRDKNAVISSTDLYIVKTGDTVDSIAHIHGTTLANILKMNDLRMDAPLFVGQKLKVPKLVETGMFVREKAKNTGSRSPKPDLAITYYKVKKGESLATIALRHGTTLGILLKLNEMKIDEPLFVGRRIKIPQKSLSHGRS